MAKIQHNGAFWRLLYFCITCYHILINIPLVPPLSRNHNRSFFLASSEVCVCVCARKKHGGVPPPPTTKMKNWEDFLGWPICEPLSIVPLMSPDLMWSSLDFSLSPTYFKLLVHIFFHKVSVCFDLFGGGVWWLSDEAPASSSFDCPHNN